MDYTQLISNLNKIKRNELKEGGFWAATVIEQAIDAIMWQNEIIEKYSNTVNARIAGDFATLRELANGLSDEE